MANRIPYKQNKPPVGSVINGAHPLSQGLVGCWLLNENGGGKANDISGNNNVGTLNNGITWDNTSARWDGSDDNITVPASSSLSNWNAISVCFSFQIRGTINRYSRYFEKGVNSEITISDWGGNYGIVIENLGGDNPMLSSPNTYNDGLWHDVVVTITADATATIILYVDGKNVGSTTHSQPPDKTHSMTFGDYGGSGNYSFNGGMKNFRIYRRVLSPQEVQELYVNPYAGILMPRRRNITQQVATDIIPNSNFFFFYQ